tara:strand:- start:1113 stop:1412 length:300 start_codon:yes stop_codon:yes gene_type:complete
MVKVEILKSNRNDKRFVAIFYDSDNKKIKTTHFGLKNPKIGTFIDHQNKEMKQNYLKRHIKNEKWNDFETAGSLSRFILWNKPTLVASLNDYKRRFNLK